MEPADIDYKGLFEQLQGENEDLKLKLWKATVGRKYPFSTALRNFRALSYQERYILILSICMIAYTLAELIRAVRGLQHE